MQKLFILSKRLISGLCWPILLYMLPHAASSQCTNMHPDDLMALRALYTSTNGDSWTNKTGWDQIMSTTPVVCDLTHIFGLTFSGNQVLQINLPGNNLSGNLPPEIGDFAALESLDLGNEIRSGMNFLNQITGSIPTEIGQLSQLQILRLSANQLNGMIPRSISLLSNLYQLDLRNNQINDIIAPELVLLTNLRTLDLSSNLFHGPIPSFLGSLSHLQLLELISNNLSGPIPIEIYSLNELRSLSLGGGTLTGAIDPAIGNLVNLQYLFIYSSEISGPIPASIGNLHQLVLLDLYNNLLDGSIPPELGNLSNLVRLVLARNMLSGNIPGELGNLIHLAQFWAYENDLSGCYDSNLHHLCGAFVALDDAEFDVPWAAFCTDPDLGCPCEIECPSAISYALEGCIDTLIFPSSMGLEGDCLTSIEVIQTSTGAVIFDSSGRPNAIPLCEPLSLQVTAADGSYCESTITFIADAPIDAHVASFAGISMYDYVHHHVPGIISCFVLGVRYEDQAIAMCEGLDVQRTWYLTDGCGNSTMLNQVFEVYGTAICRFRDLGELWTGHTYWMNLEIPEQIDMKGYNFTFESSNPSWKILSMEGPSAQVYVGEGAADLIAHIQTEDIEYAVLQQFNSTGEQKWKNDLSQNDTDWNLYPNPGIDHLILRISPELENVDVEIWSLTGQLVKRYYDFELNHHLDISGIQAGAYLLKVISDQQTLARRFVKL